MISRGAVAVPRDVLASGLLAIPAIAIATLLWGVSTSVAKLALDEYPPLSQALFRFAVALLILAPLARLKGGQLALGRRPALLGLIGIALFYALHNLGLHATSGTNASLILDGGTPALTIVLGALLLGERPKRLGAAGLLISLAGIGGVVLASGSGELGAGHGDALMLGSAALWALYSVVGRTAFAEHGVLPVVAGSTMYGVLFLAPLAIVEILHNGAPRFTAKGTSLIIFLALGCSVFAYLLFGHALLHLSTWQVASWTTLMPLIGVVAAVMLLQEPLIAAQAVGGALIVLGVVLTSLPHAAVAADRGETPPWFRRLTDAAQHDEPSPGVDHPEAIIWPSTPERKSLHDVHPRTGSASPTGPQAGREERDEQPRCAEQQASDRK